MRGEERREKIFFILSNSELPIKGSELAEEFNISRQVVVQDIALLRAEGKEIIATPQGYIVLKAESKAVTKIIPVKHLESELEDELKTIISLGGRIIDVTIEHNVYGEITGKLMLKTIKDVDNFIVKLKGSMPLSYLTQGVHLHTIEGDSEEDIEEIISVLRTKGYLLDEE